jgi:anaerobic selenocysteine-containing dehydrogenase
MKNLAEGKLKLVVVDPRFSKIASKAHKWIPIKPGTEAAFALAMIRWIIENGRYDGRFLANANKAAAVEDGEQSWTNAAWLVKEDGSFLRASEIGLAEKVKRINKDGKEWEFDAYVIMSGGTPLPFDPNDEKTAANGDLLVNSEVGGIKVKSALQIIYESAASKTLDEWASICDVPATEIAELAREFTSHGKRAVTDLHRGVSQHTNGFYNVLTVYTLNALVGNWDWKGGLIKASTYNILGEKEGQPFNLTKLHPAKFKPFGLSIIRHEAKYEESTIFAGYPAKRNWYPFSSDVYQEIIPSIGDAYPYPTEVLFLYMAAPTYSLPGGHTNIEVLSDVTKIPLIIACDITVGETSMYADYIFPDLTYLERWEFHGSHPCIPPKVQPIRNPVIAPITEAVTVFGEEMPISLEAMILGIAERLGLPGFGRNGFADGMDFLRAEDFYLKMAANVAAGEKAGDSLPEADDDELRIFLSARRHLPATVFDPAKWENAAGKANWRRVVYLLNRGGRFQDSQKAFDGDKFANKYGSLVNLYLEKYVKAKSPITGKPYPGCATYLPIQNVDGRLINDELDGFNLQLITYREIAHTKSRTVADPWLLAISPENHILMNPLDAERLGFSDGANVRVTSRSNPEGVWDLRNGTKKPMIGSIRVTPGIRPGVIAFSLGMGHWAYGSTDIFVDGLRIKGDPKRGRGLHANAAMRLDDYLKNTCLLDPVGGSVSFYDTMVRLVKV